MWIKSCSPYRVHNSQHCLMILINRSNCQSSWEILCSLHQNGITPKIYLHFLQWYSALWTSSLRPNPYSWVSSMESWFSTVSAENEIEVKLVASILLDSARTKQKRTAWKNVSSRSQRTSARTLAGADIWEPILLFRKHFLSAVAWRRFNKSGERIFYGKLACGHLLTLYVRHSHMRVSIARYRAIDWLKNLF